MTTLYDLLGALPNDDADDIRTAFRAAVKCTHPDINPGDPEAALKFRQIIRANDILGDPDQRAAYDHLLELARTEQAQTMKRAFVAGAVHHIASGVLAVAGFSVVALAGYALFMHVSAASVTASNEHQASGATSAPIAALALPERNDAGLQTSPQENVAPAAAQTVGQGGLTPRTGATVEPSAAIGAPLDLAAGDAKSFRERGVSAYRNGDLKRAVAEFNMAIQRDPNFADAYIDRGIAFYRLRKFERAFDDIDRARSIQKANRAKTTTVMAGQRMSHVRAPLYDAGRGERMD